MAGWLAVERPVALGLWLAAASVAADEAAAPSIDVHAFVDVAYALNANSPPDHVSFTPGVGTTAKRSDEVSLNLAGLDVSREAKPVGFHLLLVAGTGADVLHSAEPAGTGVGPGVLRHVYQASAAYRAPVGRGLLFQAGIFPSHVGFETFLAKDNWSYTRSWMADLSPYYQTGVCASYAFDDRWSAQLHVLNGWQIVGDNNHSKTFGSQVSWSAPRLSVTLNTLAGPELPNDDAHWRWFGDVVVTAKPTPRLSLAASEDYGRQTPPGVPGQRWHAGAVSARFASTPRTDLALRAGYYSDPQGAMTGTGQTLHEVTATVEFRPAAGLLLRLEARRDRSTRAVFSASPGEGDARGRSKSQFLVVAAAVVGF